MYVTWSFLLQACADKLQREIETFGCPPQFPEEIEPSEEKQVRLQEPYLHVSFGVANCN